jgi:hypothetical protein
MKIWVLQYKSIDGEWYDSGAFDSLANARHVWMNSGRRENYRVVERTDKVVLPVPVDPASEAGA